MKKRLNLAMVMALTTVTLAGCGGSGDSSSQASSQPDTKASAVQESGVSGSGTEAAADAYEIMVAYENVEIK